MWSILNRRVCLDRPPRFIEVIFLAALFFVVFPPSFVFAATGDDRMTLTVSPSIFNLNAAPGDVFRSYVRVVNGNTYPVTVHASVENFRPHGETGNPVFDLNHVPDPDGRTLASWVKLDRSIIFTQPGQTLDVPFTITVPKDAEPGGHYGGILVGTSPLERTNGSGLAIGSFISSLLLLRVSGDVIEEGKIRDFYADPWFVSGQKADFTLRFENTGNVHVIPNGEIIITNMWGKERGRVAINDTDTFGNVLPGMTRKFTFTWEGEHHILEFGRYTANAVLSYGVDGKHSATRVAHFWIVPWKEMLLVLGTLLLIAFLISWSVRRYIRRALEIEAARLGVPVRSLSEGTKEFASVSSSEVAKGDHALQRSPQISIAVLARPLKEPERRAPDTKGVPQRRDKLADPRILLALVVTGAILGIAAIGWYFVEVLETERTFHVEITHDEKSVL